ncbi:Fur family transcriptional regulator [Peptoniphilus porci]|uniref:Fur family transcriptional regulator n=1 Tax=Peptoniphilus porci TaxID=2652280 RepID=UPI001F2C28CF|nr:transcriptional repressor [Peptoniphilus porci]
MKSFEDILRKNNLKITKGRLALLNLLYSSHVPMNTEEIYEAVDKKSLPSFTSLYRMLNELTEKKYFKKNLYHNGLYYFEFANMGHRHYIVCDKCGKISAIENCPISDLKILQKGKQVTLLQIT